MRSTIKKYLCSPIDNPAILDGFMNTEYIMIYNLADPYLYLSFVISRRKRNRRAFFGFLYDRLPFEKGKRWLGHWFRHADWSDECTPMEAYVKYLAPYK